MTVTLPENLSRDQAKQLWQSLKRDEQRHAARAHPAHFLSHVRCVEGGEGEAFRFDLLADDWHDQAKAVSEWQTHRATSWAWQRYLLEQWLAGDDWIGLKGRQIGVTWLAAGFQLWKRLARAGTRGLVISTNETEASKVINRQWDMFESLPEHLRMGVEVLKPSRGARPYLEIEWRHPDGRISAQLGVAATKKAGRGETISDLLLDEFAFQDYAAEIWTGVIPTIKDRGQVLVVSTANGVSNESTGGGNFFHHICTNASSYGLKSDFLSWRLAPHRDDEWYASVPLEESKKAQEYPNTPEEAFILSGRPYFDRDGMRAYASVPNKPLVRGEFEPHGFGKAKFARSDDGRLSVWEEPREGVSYAIGADVATGRGADYSAAYVVDLSEMRFVAEFHGKLDADLYALQLHYMARWFNGALVAVETGGGFGDSVIAALRDGRSDRPPYPHLYRHVHSSRSDLPVSKPFGFPMTSKTRPLVVGGLAKAVREQALPFLPSRLLSEMWTFVHADTLPSPRAQEGCNDDCVMAAGIALELYRLKGHHPERTERRERRKKARDPFSSARKRRTSYPWQTAA